MNNIKIHNFRELKVWQKSMVIVKLIYTTTSSFPKSETFGIVSQIQRAAGNSHGCKTWAKGRVSRLHWLSARQKDGERQGGETPPLVLSHLESGCRPPLTRTL